VAASDTGLQHCLSKAVVQRHHEHLLLVHCDADEALHLHLILKQYSRLRHRDVTTSCTSAIKASCSSVFIILKEKMKLKNKLVGFDNDESKLW
jgi:hypothetical protein